MHKKVGALSALCVAIAAAMVAPVAGARGAPAHQSSDEGQAVQRQGDASSQAVREQAPGQESAATDPRPQVETVTLETITVTANRRAETLQDVALPVSVLTYHQIDRQHLQGFEDYVNQVPGFNYVSYGPGQTELIMRGIASGSAQSSASVGVYVDDTPLGSSSIFAGGAALALDLDPGDLQRIEVLRGPQGTLYGAGSLSGLIKFVTIEPDTENYSGRLELSGTSVDGGGNGFGLRGMVNLPMVADKLALRASVYDRTDPGFIDDALRGASNINESRVKGGRASLLWTPTTSTSVRVTALAQNLNSDGGPIEDVDPATLRPMYGDLTQVRGPDTGFFDARYRLYNVTFKTDLGWSTLVSSTSYSTLDENSSGDNTGGLGPLELGLKFWNPIRQTKLTQEIRLESPESQQIEWLGGLFFTHETGNSVQYLTTYDYATGAPIPSPFGPLGDARLPSTYDAYAAFGSVTWHLSDRFEVEAGLRYSPSRQHFQQTTGGFLFGPTTTFGNRSSESSTTFSLTPTFHVTDDTMVYARVASGFIPGGPNVAPPDAVDAPRTFSPTKLTNYELGLKAASPDNRLTFDVSAFYIDWTKIPLTTVSGVFAFIGSGSTAESRGLEATIAYTPVRGLNLSANFAYTDAKLTKDTPPPTNGKDGDRLPYSPKWNVSLNGDYDFPLRGGWNGFVGASYRSIGARMADFNFDGTPRQVVPGYHTVDLRAGATRDQWTVSAYVKNVTNERGIVLLGTPLLNPFTGMAPETASIITPRMFGISVSKDF